MLQRLSTPSKIVGGFFDPRPSNIIWFLFGSVTLGVAGNSMFGLLTSWDYPRWWLGILLPASLGGLFLAATSIQLRYRFQASREPAIQVKYGGDVEPHRALVVFVSGATGTAHEDAVNWHIYKESEPVLRHCWLIHPEFSKDRAKVFNQHKDDIFAGIIKFYVGEHDELCLDDVNNIKSAYDMYLSVISRILEQGIPKQDIIVDVTGGTALVTAGAVWACAKRGISAEYIKQRVTPTTFVKVDVAWAEGLTFVPAEASDAI
ncbi:MAG TPA: hypothetical protein VFA70_06505 [Dehalococcoidia bacterium]|nr:hypothetical protein [Dehalococcoidia bacterium]